MVGIISNASAMQAQRNLDKANTQTEKSIGRLSSGQRIVKAADDVAGLAVGTILKTNISTMKAALTNAAQASSLLSIADGALDNIGQILQRQKALASQATSGSLDNTARGFLDQEFQNLKKEVDRISTSTNFNGIRLIDGGLFNASKITTDIRNNSTSAASVMKFVTAIDSTKVIKFFDKAATNPKGFSQTTFTSVENANAALKTFPTSLLTFDGTVSNTGAVTNFMLMVEGLRKYSGETAAVVSGRKTVSSFNFVQTATDTISITAKSAGSVWNDIEFINDQGDDTKMTLNGVKFDAAVAIDAGTAGVDGALPAGSFSAGTTCYSDDGVLKGLVPSVYAQGSVSDSLLTALTSTAVATTGVDFSNISNNPAFVGKMPQFTGSYVDKNIVNLKVTIGGIDYIANAVGTNPAATDTQVVFYSNDSSYGSFIIQLASTQGMSVSSTTDANTFVARLNKSFDKIDIYQRREITSFTPAGTVYPTGSATASGNLSGSKFWLINNDFSDVKIEDVKVRAPATGATEAVVEFVINGETYRSGYDYDGSVRALGTDIKNNDGVNTDGRNGFVSQTNPNRLLVWDYASTTLSISNDAEAEGLERALKQAFNIGTGSGGAGLKFQVGTASSDAIDVQIASTRSKNIYLDENKNFIEIKINTQSDAEIANDILDNAINNVISVRAQVGALQSRFDLAQANIKSSIENQDAARGLFLDTDVSIESTELAQSQVRLQASISVLAQANQLPQVLLKLIG